MVISPVPTSKRQPVTPPPRSKGCLPRHSRSCCATAGTATIINRITSNALIVMSYQEWGRLPLGRLEWYIVVLFPRHFCRFVPQRGECPAHPFTRGSWLDHLVDKAAFRRYKWVRETVLIVRRVLRDFLGVAKVGAVDDLRRPFGTHHRNLCRGPGIVEIAAQVFGRHHHVGAAIGFAGDHRHLRHCRFRIGKEQLGPVLDHAAIFLRGAGQKARHVDQGEDRDVKAIAEAHEPGSLAGAVDVQNPRQHHGLVGHNADRLTLKPDKAGDDILGELFLKFVKVALIRQFGDQLFHVVRAVGVVGHKRIKARLDTRRLVKEGAHGRLFAVVGRQEIYEATHLGQRFHVVLERRIRDGRLLGVGGRAAQFFGGDLFVGDRLDHIGAGDKHVRTVFDHKDKVGHRGAIDRATGTGAHYDADLRHDARGNDIALKHFAVAGQAVDTFLNAGTTGIVDPDHRRTILDRHVHDLADLGGMGGRHRPAQNGEVLAKDIDHTPVDGAPAGNNAVACGFLFFHPEIGAAMRDKHVKLFERVLVQQQFDPLAGGQLAAPMLCVDPLLPAAQTCIGAARLKFGQDVFHGRPTDGLVAAYSLLHRAETIIRHICKVYA
mmetsp:Transcript_27766/g.51710  ORF Transcript_27766/g.51710 Transcript_27766/m.51710 type:complete len:605 (+) Transcript_27766:2391-4205(+)